MDPLFKLESTWMGEWSAVSDHRPVGATFHGTTSVPTLKRKLPSFRSPAFPDLKNLERLEGYQKESSELLSSHESKESSSTGDDIRG